MGESIQYQSWQNNGQVWNLSTAALEAYCAHDVHQPTAVYTTGRGTNLPGASGSRKFTCEIPRFDPAHSESEGHGRSLGPPQTVLVNEANRNLQDPRRHVGYDVREFRLILTSSSSTPVLQTEFRMSTWTGEYETFGLDDISPVMVVDVRDPLDRDQFVRGFGGEIVQTGLSIGTGMSSASPAPNVVTRDGLGTAIWREQATVTHNLGPIHAGGLTLDDGSVVNSPGGISVIRASNVRPATLDAVRDAGGGAYLEARSPYVVAPWTGLFEGSLELGSAIQALFREAFVWLANRPALVFVYRLHDTSDLYPPGRHYSIDYAGVLDAELENLDFTYDVDVPVVEVDLPEEHAPFEVGITLGLDDAPGVRDDSVSLPRESHFMSTFSPQLSAQKADLDVSLGGTGHFMATFSPQLSISSPVEISLGAESHFMQTFVPMLSDPAAPLDVDLGPVVHEPSTALRAEYPYSGSRGGFIPVM